MAFSIKCTQGKIKELTKGDEGGVTGAAGVAAPSHFQLPPRTPALGHADRAGEQQWGTF